MINSNISYLDANPILTVWKGYRMIQTKTKKEKKNTIRKTELEVFQFVKPLVYETTSQDSDFRYVTKTKKLIKKGTIVQRLPYTACSKVDENGKYSMRFLGVDENGYPVEFILTQKEIPYKDLMECIQKTEYAEYAKEKYDDIALRKLNKLYYMRKYHNLIYPIFFLIVYNLIPKVCDVWFGNFVLKTMLGIMATLLCVVLPMVLICGYTYGKLATKLDAIFNIYMVENPEEVYLQKISDEIMAEAILQAEKVAQSDLNYYTAHKSELENEEYDDIDEPIKEETPLCTFIKERKEGIKKLTKKQEHFVKQKNALEDFGVWKTYQNDLKLFHSIDLTQYH